MSKQSENIIEIEELNVTFSLRKKDSLLSHESKEIRAIDGVTLNVRNGEILAIVGESGCGKTTLGKAVLNLVQPTSGIIRYRGQNLVDISKNKLRLMRQKFQLIYQDPYESLDPRQSVFQTLLEPLTIHRKDLNKDDKKQMIYHCIESVGLHPAQAIAARYPHHLSGGQRQRVAIAAAIILEPDFVVADEPVSMLDVSVRSEILKVMLELRNNKELTYLFITHDLSLAWMVAERIAVFYLGKMVEIGSAHEIVHHSVHPYSQALISVIPTISEQASLGRHILQGEIPLPSNIPMGCRFHTRCWLYQKKKCPSICRESEPVLKDVGTSHQAACHFMEED